MNLVQAWETLLAGNCVQVDSNFGVHIYKLDENKFMKYWNFTDLKWEDSSFGYLTDSNYIENKEDPEKQCYALPALTFEEAVEFVLQRGRRLNVKVTGTSLSFHVSSEAWRLADIAMFLALADLKGWPINKVV